MNLDSFKEALRPGVSLKEVGAWASYDFANSGYSTVVLTAVYNAFFVSVVAGRADWATLAWTCAVSFSNLCSIAVIPYISAKSDQNASKKFWLGVLTVLCVVFTGLLGFTGAGTIAFAALCVVVSNIAFNAGVAVNSAFLSELAKPSAYGKVSGWGWGFGYLGGIVTLTACLAIVMGFPSIPMPQRVGWCMVATAAIFAAGALPMFLFVKERSEKQKEIKKRSSLAEFSDTLRLVRKSDRPFLWLCIAGVLYQAGIAVVITLSAVYAEGVMKFTTQDTILLILLVNFTAAAGAWGFGYLEDWLGHKKTLYLTLGVWILMVLIAGFTTSNAMFWLAANLAGIAMGSSQSAGRSLVAVLAPSEKLTQYYSMWNVAVWTANVIGPISYGLVTWVTSGNQRLAILVTGLFFVFGALALTQVKLPKNRG